ncbi:MAG TPA: cyanoexosortase A, partial [Allocoleopsis sp.]
AAFLMAINLALMLRLNTDIVRIAIYVVAWCLILINLWSKRRFLQFNSDVFSSFLGLVLIIFVVQKNLFSVRPEPIIEILPFMTGLGLVLIGAGFKGFKQFWLEILILLAICIPEGIVLEYVIDLGGLTAKFAGLILYRFGFDASLQGHYIILPKGTVEVENGCAGVGSILILWKTAILFLYKFNLSRNKKILIQSVAVVLGFIVNTIRVAIMAFLVTYSTSDKFHYWHDGEGAQIFLFSALLVFGIFGYFMIPENE